MTQKAKTQSGKQLRIIPLGGQEEVGRNMTVFEYGSDIVILDMGIQFPEEDMPGIDYIIPNVNYLRGKERNIRGVIFSHGHLDHIGAGPILLEKLGNPLIFGRPLTLALIKNRQEDYRPGTANRLKAKTITDINQTFKLGAFSVSFFPVDHSIMDAVGVILKTPAATAVHPGDWTYEHDPVGRTAITYEHLAKLPKPTVLMLESLGATKTTRVPEKTMYENLEKIITTAPGRIIIGTFSSQIARIANLIPLAEKHGRKIILDGHSMKVNIEIAQRFGYIKIKKDTLVPVNRIADLPDKRVIVICTGAQGEPRAVLPRIVDGSHRFIKIKESDTVIFSSSVIPGNERTIQRLKDNLYRLTENVIHSDIMDIHSGGHSTAQDIVTFLNQAKPTYYMPVYANHYFLKEAKKLAVRTGMPEKNIFVLDNGAILEVQGSRARIAKNKVPTDYVYVDGLGIGDISHIVLRDRQQLANEGMVVIIATIDKQGRLVGQADVISRGFIYAKENREIIDKIKDKVKKILQHHETKGRADEDIIRNKLRDDVGQMLYSMTERRPMVLPLLIDV